ncbi:quinone oxidoreductase family protein [Actinophytocola sp.]|uniref:quinone oxidoreductase family protein n=1 Tax=Actinophytocola sp. TaxID=1872138 RepID=UPI002ED129CE
MKAARIHSWGGRPSLDEVPDPTGETLVRIEAAAVAHLDLTVASGNFHIKPDLPHIGGVEGCGIVVSSDVHEPGTRVMLRGGGLGLMRAGTWAELVGTRSRNVVPLPANLSPELGATYFVPTTTAYTALHVVAQLGGDETVIVAGAAGAVGSMVVQLALRAGATVIGLVAGEQVDRLPDGVEAVRLDDEARAAELTHERPATLLVDTLGGQGLAGRSRWVRPGGRAVAVGYVAGTDVRLDLPNWLLEDVALLPVNMIRRDATAREHAPMLARLLATGELALEVESFDMADAATALDRLATGGLRGRAVLTP